MIPVIAYIEQLQREMRAWERHRRYILTKATQFDHLADAHDEPSGKDLLRRIADRYDGAANNTTEPDRIQASAMDIVDGQRHLLPEELRP